MEKPAAFARQDRDRGLMVGIAAGNLLGISLEGRLRLEIADKYPGLGGFRAEARCHPRLRSRTTA